MAKKAKPTNAVELLRRVALDLPETSEGIACAGTSLEKRTIKAGTKAFLFLGASDAMLKLKDSLAEAQKLAARQPTRCKAGANGWVTVRWSDEEPPPIDLLEKWIEESHALMAPAKKSPAPPKPKSKRTSTK